MEYLNLLIDAAFDKRILTMHIAQLRGGTSTAIGGLPHRDATSAVVHSLRNVEMPAIPRLPRRSPAEEVIAQAMVGMRGVTIGQYGSVSVDPSQVDAMAPLVTDLSNDAFVGFRSFVEQAPDRLGRDYDGWVKWQFVGPVTLGLSLTRAGVPTSEAFSSAVRAVRTRVQALLDVVEGALPNCTQLVFIEEPGFGEVARPEFPIAADTAIDLVSGALAAVERTSLTPVSARAVSGLHCCGLADIPSQLATGPAVLSLPVHLDVVAAAGYLIRFLESGGYVAWGVVPTSAPISASADRPWRRLCALWCELVRCGADPVRLRNQALVTAECGLSAHSQVVAQRVHTIVAEVGRRVRDQAAATQWTLGA